jgi:hypothetical protein
MATPIDEIQRVFWPSGESSRRIWAILDGARDRNVYWGLLNSYQNYACLYAGDLAPALEVVAPYLVQLDFDDAYTRDLLKLGWGNSWGVFLECDSSMQSLRRHLRGYLRVRDERGRKLVFRYYDPRVLRIYLPTCNAEEAKTVFGPIRRFWTESETGNELLEFRFERGRVVRQAIDRAAHAARVVPKIEAWPFSD